MTSGSLSPLRSILDEHLGHPVHPRQGRRTTTSSPESFTLGITEWEKDHVCNPEHGAVTNPGRGKRLLGVAVEIQAARLFTGLFSLELDTGRFPEARHPDVVICLCGYL